MNKNEVLDEAVRMETQTQVEIMLAKLLKFKQGLLACQLRQCVHLGCFSHQIYLHQGSVVLELRPLVINSRDKRAPKF